MRGKKSKARKRRSCLSLYVRGKVESSHLPGGTCVEPTSGGLEWAVSLSGRRQPHLAA